MVKKAVVRKPKAAKVEKTLDVSAFDSLTGHVRIHFKNGHSGEYDGAQLRHCAPFDLNQVSSIEPV